MKPAPMPLSILFVYLAALASACGEGAPTSEGFLGTYNLPEQVDEVNLTLRTDGTFRWMVFGCDFEAEEEGRWTSEGDRVRLTPGPGRSEFRWVNGPTFQHKTASLFASLAGADLNIVGPDLEQTWRRGRICAKCGTLGYFGPSGLEPCSDQSGF